jgi:cytochrome b pre-mRNA-processing protein 3
MGVFACLKTDSLSYFYKGCKLMLQWLRQKVLEWSRPASVEAETLYNQLAIATRNPDIYHSYQIEDSFDGRFDTVCLFAALMVRRLTRIGNDGKARAQELTDTMFADMDLSLHEIGVSENKVSKKVKVMATAFVGRVQAYGQALDEDDLDALAAALRRNLYRDRDMNGIEQALSKAVMATAKQLDKQPDKSLIQGQIGIALTLKA